MKNYLDTEFLEGCQDKRFLDYRYRFWFNALTLLSVILLFLLDPFDGFLKSLGISLLVSSINLYSMRFEYKTPNTIDLISIGIVSEDDREYYAISKDFNLKEAWNRYDEKTPTIQGRMQREYWIRENVLKTIFKDLLELHNDYLMKQKRIIGYAPELNQKFTYKNFKRLLKKYGKTNKEIAEEIKSFVYDLPVLEKQIKGFIPTKTWNSLLPIEFYAYYADYDWVVFCWLFGNMINLPKGFPKYCRDLKQILDDKVENYDDRFMSGNENFETKLSYVKNKSSFPEKTNEHNALADARWDKELHKFLNTI